MPLHIASKQHKILKFSLLLFEAHLRQGLQALAGSGSVECTSRRLESEPAADNVQH